MSAVLMPLLAGYLLLGLYYALALPLFAKPDEMYHQAVVRYLYAERRLPQVDLAIPPNAPRPVHEFQAHQPPLYYGIVLAPRTWFLATALVPPHGQTATS